MIEQFRTGRGNDVLRRLPQGDFHQWRGLDAHLEQVGHQSADAAKDAVVWIGRAAEHFLNARAQAFLAADEFIQHRGAFGGAAVSLAQLGKFLLPQVVLLPEMVEAVLGGGQRLGPRRLPAE